MKKEEAIELLEDLYGAIEDNHGRDYDEAFRMAIEALSKPTVDITQRDLCADISCTDCPFMKETCKLMDYVAYADRPHGGWYGFATQFQIGFKCTNCNGFSEYEYNFCPNCGADMRKENK